MFLGMVIAQWFVGQPQPVPVNAPKRVVRKWLRYHKSGFVLIDDAIHVIFLFIWKGVPLLSYKGWYSIYQYH